MPKVTEKSQHLTKSYTDLGGPEFPGAEILNENTSSLTDLTFDYDINSEGSLAIGIDWQLFRKLLPKPTKHLPESPQKETFSLKTYLRRFNIAILFELREMLIEKGHIRRDDSLSVVMRVALEYAHAALVKEYLISNKEKETEKK